MVVYPSQLTSEEKALRKRYAKLQEKTKELKQLQATGGKTDSPSQGPSIKTTLGQSQSTREPVANPKDARQAAKKLLESGKLSITKKTQKKTTGFKRVGEGASRGNPPPPTKRPTPSSSSSSSGVTTQQQPPQIKPKPIIRPAEVKQLYSRFVKASDDIKSQKIPKLSSESHTEEEPKYQATEPQVESNKDSTIYVTWRDTGLDEIALREAFLRFGSIKDIKLRGQKCESFVTFTTPNIARTVQREMNKGMIRGTEIFVEPASKENGYIELPPEVEHQPWARIAAGMEVQSDIVSRKRPISNRKTKSYEQDF